MAVGFWITAVILALVIPVSAQETSIGGEWWVSVKGGDQGAGRLTLSVPALGIFTVQGPLITMGSFGPFQITEQALQMDFKGNISGSLLVSDFPPVTDPPTPPSAIGTLQITSGRSDRRFRVLVLRGTLAFTGFSPVPVLIRGQRMPASVPVFPGRSVMDGRLSGPGLRSSTLDLTVGEDVDRDFPFFGLTGGGSVAVDGVPEDVTLFGIFARAPSKNAAKGTNIFGFGGSTDNPTLGFGPLKGNLRKTSARPSEFGARVSGNRAFSLRARLTEAVTPVMGVTPGAVDFGSVNVGESRNQDFTVTNIGAGLLSGTAAVTGAGFSIVGGDTFTDLAASESAPVTVQFQPPGVGVFNGTVTFTSGSQVTTRTVTGTGQ
jgi:hypothetical protein